MRGAKQIANSGWQGRKRGRSFSIRHALFAARYSQLLGHTGKGITLCGS
jgi:hypothetical protein